LGAHGNVVSGAILLVAGERPETLMELPGARIVVAGAVDRDNATELRVHNRTDVPLQAASDLDGTAATITLAAGCATTIPLPGAQSGVHRLHLQVFPSRPQFPDVVTLLVSAEHGSIMGQAFVSAIN
jgi:hypothetical protein